MSNYTIKVKNTSGKQGTVLADAGFSYTDNLNEVNKGQLKITGTGTVHRNLFETGSQVFISRNGTLEFHGFINGLSYLDAGGVSADISGYEIWLTKENGNYSSSPYSSTASSTIASQIIGESTKFTSGTIESGANIDFKIEETSSLWNALSSLIKVVGQDIGIDYTNTEIDILGHKGSSTSVMTLNDGVEVQHLLVRQSYPIANDVRVYGQGEGGTRIKSGASNGQDATSKSTYGTIRKIHRDPSIITQNQANALADKLVAKWKDPVKVYEFEVINPNKNLKAGDVITLNSSTKNLSNEEVRIVGIERGVRGDEEFLSLQVTNKEYSTLERDINKMIAELERNANNQQTYDQFQDEYSNQSTDTFVGGAEISVGGGWADFGDYNINTTGNLRGSHINIQGSSAGSIIWEELDMGTNKITSLATPTTDFDAATKKYVDDNLGSAGLFTKDVGNNWYKINDANYSLVPNATASGATYNNLGGPSLSEKWADCNLTGDLNADGDVNCNDMNASGIVGGGILNINASSGGNIIAGNLNMSSSKITSLGTPSSSSDAANKSYVDAHWNGSAGSNLDMNQYDIVDCDDITCDVVSANLINVGGSSSNNYFNGNVDVTGTIFASGKIQLPVGTNLY